MTFGKCPQGQFCSLQADDSDAFEIESELTDAGFMTKKSLQGHSIGSLKVLLDCQISPFQNQLLHDCFGIRNEENKLKCGINVGRSFNIFLNKVSGSSVYKYDENDFRPSGLGYKIPGGMDMESFSNSKTVMEVCDSKEELVKKRCLDLGLDANFSPNVAWKIQSGAGYSYLSNSSSKSSTKHISFLFEQSDFKLKIGDPLTNKYFSDTFKKEVTRLPGSYDRKNQEDRKVFEDFFKDWGQYLIISASGGGSVELNSSVSLDEKADSKEQLAGAKAQLESKFLSLSGGGNIFYENSSSDNISSQLLSSKVTWKGGKTSLHKSVSADQINPDSWSDWRNSTVLHPVMHFTELGLFPLHKIMSNVPGNEGILQCFFVH